MVDPVTGSAISSLLRAQTVGVSAGVAMLKTDQKATQAIINQLQKGVDQNKPSQSLAPSTSLTPSGGTLPRGSLVDRLV